MRCFYFLLLTGFFTSCGIDKEYDNEVIGVGFSWLDPGDSALVHIIKVNSKLNLNYREGDSLFWLGKIDTSVWEGIVKKVNKIDLRHLPARQAKFKDCTSVGLVFYCSRRKDYRFQSAECILSPEVALFVQEMKKLTSNQSLHKVNKIASDSLFFSDYWDDELKWFWGVAPPLTNKDEIPPPPPPPPKMYMEPTFKSKTEKARYDSTMKKVKEYESEHWYSSPTDSTDPTYLLQLFSSK